MQGYVYTRDKNGTKEAVVVDKNSGKTIALSSFSGYMAFSGGIISEGMKATAETSKQIARATIFGKVFTVADGVISGVFDKQGNPDKSMNDVVGTAATAILMGEAGAIAGFGIAGPIGSVVGGIAGSVAGAIWGEDAYEGMISGMSKAMDLADEISDLLSDYLNDVFIDDSLPQFLDHKATIPDDYFSPNIFPQVYDPLTLDLNNDGKISTLNLGDGVYFDHNGDKIAFKTSWIGKEDGILVFDKNNNGLIDNGNELFGNFTEISNSQTLNNPNNQISNSQISNNPNHNISLNQNNQNKQTSNSDSLNSQISSPKFAINGYHALSLQDSNSDGKIDTLDENFSKLKIWQDLNEDGISQSNELKTLKEHGIKSISLNFTKPTNSDILKDSSDNSNFNNINSNNSNIKNNPNSTISNNNINFNTNNPNSTNDNKATLISHFTRYDNTTSLVADIDLKVNTINSTHLDNPKELATKHFPKPNIKGQGFLKDLNITATLSPTLNNMLDNYKNLKTRKEQINLLPNLINEWVKSNSKIDINSYSLNKATISKTADINTKIVDILNKLLNLDKASSDYETKKDYLKNELKSLTLITDNDNLKNYDKLIDSIKYGGEISLNNRDIRVTPSQLNRLKSYQISKELLDEFNSIKYKLKVIDSFTGVVTKPLYYTSENDVKDIINHINQAYDNILDYSYKTLLTQTRLKEYINLMELDINETYNLNGEISYEFKLNYDNTLNHFKNINTTNPKKAFTDLAEFIELFENKNDIKDGFTLLSNFANKAKEDGVLKEYLDTLSSKTISNLSTISGTSKDDTLIGTNILDGKDTLYGLAGNDTLIGGVGDDTLIGGSGSDTYLYEDSNFGNDIIINDNSSNSVDNSLSNNLNTNSNFLNNTNLNLSNNMDNTLSNKTNHNSSFIKDKDIIKFSSDISKGDIIYKRVIDNGVITNDLVIMLKDEYSSLINSPNNTDINHQRNNQSILNNQSYNPNTPIIDKSLLTNINNSIFIKDFFVNSNSMISAIEFKDSTITKDEIINSLLTTSNLDDYINPFDKDISYDIDSKDGDDTIITHNGNDTILAGNGNDTIDSGNKNDYIDGGSGDDDSVTKRYKFIKNLKNKIKSNQIITKKIYNFKSYEFVA